MKCLNQILIGGLVLIGAPIQIHAQKPDTSGKAKSSTPKVYFIINAGDKISAFYHDQPVQVETIDEFNTYIQTHVKTLKDSWVIVTGKPKNGTFDEVMKTLKRNKFKNISTNIKD